MLVKGHQQHKLISTTNVGKGSSQLQTSMHETHQEVTHWGHPPGSGRCRCGHNTSWETQQPGRRSGQTATLQSTAPWKTKDKKSLAIGQTHLAGVRSITFLSDLSSFQTLCLSPGYVFLFCFVCSSSPCVVQCFVLYTLCSYSSRNHIWSILTGKGRGREGKVTLIQGLVQNLGHGMLKNPHINIVEQ